MADAPVVEHRAADPAATGTGTGGDHPQEQEAPQARQHVPPSQRGPRIPTDTPPHRLVEIAGQHPQAAKAMTAEQQVDALAWLLEDSDDEVMPTATYDLNVGTEDNPVWLPWTIKRLEAEQVYGLLERARREAGQNRAMRRSGEEPQIDQWSHQLRVIVAATIEPDLLDAAEKKGVVAADPFFGPMRLLARRFDSKPGVITQLFGYVMSFCGFDDADVRKQTPDTTLTQATRF